MAIISLHHISFNYGGPQLLDNLELHIQGGEKIGLLGRNGAGKSTLMKIMTRELEPDGGEVVYRQGITAARLAQEVPENRAGTCLDIVIEGLGEAGGGWELERQAVSIITQLGLDPKQPFSTLSGGKKRRVFLARALSLRPDVLLLDEPTNHQDIHAIRQLESFLLKYRGTVLFVTHDRTFLQSLSTRIVEIDRGRAFSWECDYTRFIERRDAALNAEQKAWSEFDKQLEKEENWIRQGIKARRTRNEGRVRALLAMRRERALRRERDGKARMTLQKGGQSSRVVSSAQNVTFAYGEREIIRGYSGKILRGDKIGIVGANGSGKSTLIKLLLEQLMPTAGSITLGNGVETAYFDQLRDTLDYDKTPLENLGIGGTTVTVNGKYRHVNGYLQDFLFTTDQINNPVSRLSGGEKNRLLLARLMTRRSNLLVLDEPTNDLDIESLELLEEVIREYSGTVIVVSHDRAFVNNTVDYTLALEGDGTVREYAGGYDDWLADWERKSQKRNQRAREENKAASRSRVKRKDGKPGKLSFKEQRELEFLPGKIQALENEQKGLHEKISDPKSYKQGAGQIKEVTMRLESLEAELNGAYVRWEELEERRLRGLPPGA